MFAGPHPTFAALRPRPRLELQMTPKPKQASRAGSEELAGLIRESGLVVALTGAGVSVPSGIPDFRTPGEGLWEKVDPMSVATIDAFHRDTKRCWDFY